MANAIKYTRSSGPDGITIEWEIEAEPAALGGFSAAVQSILAAIDEMGLHADIVKPISRIGFTPPEEAS